MLKKLSRGTSSLILKLALFNLALASAVVMVFATPDTIKTALSQSKLYERATDTLIDGAKKAAAKEGGQDLPLDAPEIQAAAKEAFTPDLLRDSAEKIIDGTYRWLNKETAQPEFTIDFSGARQTLAQRIGDYAANRYSGLPVCTIQQLRQLQTSSVDPFSVPCQVPGLNVSQARQRVVDQVAGSEEFIGTPVITADTLPKDEQGRTPYDQFTEAPDTLQRIKLAPWILGAVSLVSAIALFFSHDSRRAGLRNIATTLLGTGLFLLLGALIIGFAFSRMNTPDNGLNQNIDANMRASLLAAISTVVVALQKAVTIFGTIYVALGGAGLLALRFLRPAHTPQAATTDPAGHKPDTTPEDKPSSPEDQPKPQP